jgi:SAM-dependent methyltransferase
MRGPETEKSHESRTTSGFYSKFMSGQGLDIGYSGGNPNAEPVLPTAIGVDFGYPGYDGKVLPFPDESRDYVFSSHCLEHITDHYSAIKEWFRVVKTGGHLVIIVPHQFLYEKKMRPPSNWNLDHKRFYTPQKILHDIENSLQINSYRIVSLRDNDDNFDYAVPPQSHSGGAYEIELVIKRITPPTWTLL